MTWDMRYRFDQIAINSKAKKKPVEEDRHHYIGLEHLDSGSLVVSRWGADVAPKGEKLLMKKGDVLFGKRRAYQKKVAIAPFDGIFSAHGMVLRPNEEVIDKDFFPMFISSDYFLDTAISLSVGSLSPTINWKDLARQEFELPSMDKQRELAQVLWAMEETQIGYQQLLADTEELVKSRFIEMFGDPVRNPMNWEKGVLKDITSKIGSGATPKGGNASYKNEGISLIRSMNVHNGYFDYKGLAHIDGEQASLLDNVNIESNDVLLNITGASVARCCVVPDDILPARVNQHVCILRCKDDILPMFLNAVLISDQYQAKLWNIAEAGATRQALSKEKIETFQIILPPISLQKQFANFVDLIDKSKFVIQYNVGKHATMNRAAIMENS